MASPLGPVNTTSVDSSFCFRVAAVGGSTGGLGGGAGPCSNMTVNTIEMIINPSCVLEKPKAIRKATINGVRVFPYYSQKVWNGDTYGILGFSRLTDHFPAVPPADGLYLCLAMSRSSSSGCTTPRGLCFGPSCVYSLFNNEVTCCPASEAALG
ncbi:hypothetical protein PLESTB_001728200 [Pleodorina starrii]|uniref:Pherophorin domain-containing protein n=1 Tax=Pleodorina starrii TaxID=330485 RepID=A0A9W6C0J7_9CHLO|nr:hypothetical protein PLESTB_001728200 [Pleodorina starrii]